MFRRVALATIALAFVCPAFAGPASDAVRFFYVPVKWEGDAQYRDRFTGKAKELFDLNDKTPDGEIGCLDSSPALDAQDFDDPTIKKTLKLTEQLSGDSGTVTANFELFPDGSDEAKREIQWLVVNEGGTWKIADIISVTNGWKLSELECLPEG